MYPEDIHQLLCHTGGYTVGDWMYIVGAERHTSTYVSLYDGVDVTIYNITYIYIYIFVYIYIHIYYPPAPL